LELAISPGFNRWPYFFHGSSRDEFDFNPDIEGLSDSPQERLARDIAADIDLCDR
jgi:hypothetical protein